MRTLLVSGGRAGAYPTIADALAVAPAGSTIQIAAGAVGVNVVLTPAKPDAVVTIVPRGPDRPIWSVVTRRSSCASWC
ncbi:hypothetical protein [Allorhizocola rhizosphaerae]|uniref:hypothetical protein n=1 Tax=Allorhizocola rhizosphaerae TaxID=1872709 RepID=UPI000E3E67C7|nr:hypothetical protein [Allorhizocola rhizosphaerae]